MLTNDDVKDALKRAGFRLGVSGEILFCDDFAVLVDDFAGDTIYVRVEFDGDVALFNDDTARTLLEQGVQSAIESVQFVSLSRSGNVVRLFASVLPQMREGIVSDDYVRLIQEKAKNMMTAYNEIQNGV